MKKLTIVLLFAAGVYSCAKKVTPTSTAKTEQPPVEAPAPPPPPPVAAIAEKPSSDLIASGQRVFETRCGKCHGLKNPGNYTQVRWVDLVNVMAPKARITDEEKAQVLAYVQHNAKDAPKGN